jgi:hypothetical protein
VRPPAGLWVHRARSDGGGVRDLRPAVWGGAVGEPAGAAGVDGDDAGGLDRDVRSATHTLVASADGCVRIARFAVVTAQFVLAMYAGHLTCSELFLHRLNVLAPEING